MGIKQLYNDNLRKLPNEYRDVSIMQGVGEINQRFAFIVKGVLSRKVL